MTPHFLSAFPLSRLTSSCHNESQIPVLALTGLVGDSFLNDFDEDLEGEACLDLDGDEAKSLTGDVVADLAGREDAAATALPFPPWTQSVSLLSWHSGTPE